MKKITLIITICIFHLNIFSQGIGQWTTHFSYEQDIETILQGEDEVFALTDGKLFSYDPVEDSFETYAKISGDDISKIAYSKKYKCVIIVRENGDIDLQYTKERFTNIPGLKNISQNLDKTINDIYVKDDFAYISTNFGLVVLNLNKEEIKESVITRYPFYSSCVYNDLLYVVTTNGARRVDPKSNIQYFDGWEEISFSDKYGNSDEFRFRDNEIRQLSVFDNKIVFLIPNKAVYTFDNQNTNTLLKDSYLQKMVVTNNRMIVFQPSIFWNYTDLNTVNKIQTTNQFNYVYPDKEKSNEFWIALKNEQLSAIKINPSENTHEYIEGFRNKRPNGPSSNFSFFLKYEFNKLLFTGGEAYNNAQNRPGSLSEYSQNRWFSYDKQKIDSLTKQDTKDYLCAVTDPKDPSRIYLGTYGYGIIEFKDREPIAVFNETNTPAFNRFDDNYGVVVNTMNYDKNNNLWLATTRSKDPIKYLENGKTQFASLHYDEFGEMKYDDRPRRIFIDRNSNKWLISLHGKPYIFIFNNGNGKNDKKMITTFYDDAGKSVNNIGFYDIVEDQKGNIWLGTATGVYVVYNTSQIFTREFVLNRIKVAKNDGTGNADILLEGVQTTAIAVDGGNRLWFGTPAGLYAVSNDGQETYHHFTTENSFLPSNNVISLAIDPNTGIVYVGTDKGLVSYRGEATSGKESFSEVYVFPNPVRPDYTGPITITGLKENSNVKITDVKGNLIHQGVSWGGQYIWNGKNVNRDRVDTGVYLIFGASEDGKEGVVTKLMVISE